MFQHVYLPRIFALVHIVATRGATLLWFTTATLLCPFYHRRSKIWQQNNFSIVSIQFCLWFAGVRIAFWHVISTLHMFKKLKWETGSHHAIFGHVEFCISKHWIYGHIAVFFYLILRFVDNKWESHNKYSKYMCTWWINTNKLKSHS